jgi:hypothetical protein
VVISLAASEIAEGGLMEEGAGQGDLDADDHLGDSRVDLDQPEADRVEPSIASERGAGSQAAQAQHQP